MATPPDFVAGEVLTAAQMNKIGLWLVKTETIGTTVSSVAVASAFSADYDNYLILVSGGVGSTTLQLNMTLGATAAGYYYSGTKLLSYAATSVTGDAAQNTTSFPGAGSGSTNSLHARIEVFQPFATKNTHVLYQTAQSSTTGQFYTRGGYLADTTSYTAFTLTTSTGTITGGTVYVYGYRD
jgi:hypothetical protein